MNPAWEDAGRSLLEDWLVHVELDPSGSSLTVYTQALFANGAKVYIGGRRKETLEAAAKAHGGATSGGSIVPIELDVTCKKSIATAVGHITKTEGYLNLLVNNAGTWLMKPEKGPQDGPEAFAESMFTQDVDLWQQSFLTNATSLYFVTAAFLPRLAKSIDSPTKKIGNVINTTSNSGLLRLTESQQLAYNVSKGAAVHLTRQIAHDFSHERINIRVNNIAPGWFPSEIATGGKDERNESTPQDDAAFKSDLDMKGTRCPKGRVGKPKDLASALLTLATNEYIWGVVMVVDGGITQATAGQM